MSNESSKATNDKYEKHQRCELCNVPVSGNPRSDIRSSDVFHGKGSVLCSKCAAILQNMPAKQAIQALDNASKIYGGAKE